MVERSNSRRIDVFGSRASRKSNERRTRSATSLPPYRSRSVLEIRIRCVVVAPSRTVTSASQPSVDSRRLTAIRSAEGNDEERLAVLDRRAAGDEDLADLAVRGRADLGDVAERLDAAQDVPPRNGVAGAPLARRVEDPDGRRMDTLRLFDGRFGVHDPGGFAVATPESPLTPGHRDREAVRLDLDRRAGEALGQLEIQEIVDESEQRVGLAQLSPPAVGLRIALLRIRRHHGRGGAGACPPLGSTIVPNARNRSYRSDKRSAIGTRARRST